MYDPSPGGHYPNATHYPTTTTAATVPLSHPQPPSTHRVPTPDPPEPSVTAPIASKALQRLISVHLQHAGFEKAVSPALHRLELEVSTFIQQLFQRAHEYANLANRASAIASDLLLACNDFDLPPKDLLHIHRPPLPLPALLPPLDRPSSPELLSSDDEDAPTDNAATLRSLPSHFPNLPPKHTYLQTPPSPPKRAALPSLEKKLKTAALVQESLQNLLLATEENMNQEDAELLGHIVNWETNLHPRKRWTVGRP